jgi:xylose dehydrogenase (NAD/NADP)
MPLSRLRWGFLSTAHITKELIGPLHISKRNQLLAVASRSKVKADEYARINKVKHSFGSYSDLLEAPDIDVIYNPLPNHLHAEWTIKALQLGKHVLCEKPLALTLAEVDAIKAAAELSGKVVVEAFMYRSHQQTLKAREIVASGRLGQVKLVRGSFTYPGIDPENYRWKPEMGGGSLLDVGCYPLSYTRFLLGIEPLEVFAWQVIGTTGVDEIFTAQMRFPGDIFAQFDCSVNIPYHAFMEIIGDISTLIIPKPFTPAGNEKLFQSKNGKVETIPVKGRGSYQGEVEDLADAVLDGKPPRVSLEDSRAYTSAILALFESAKTGKPVLLQPKVTAIDPGNIFHDLV